MCIKSQCSKIARFIENPCPQNAIHAIYNSNNFSQAYGDEDYGHLQIDSISLFLIFLSYLFLSKTFIIQSYEEFILIQNLVFYIEKAFQIAVFNLLANIFHFLGLWHMGKRR